MMGRVEGFGLGHYVGETARLVSAANQGAERFGDVLERAAKAMEDGGGSSGPSAETMQLWQAARGLESLFLQALLQGMRRTVPEGGLFSKGFAAETYESMYDQYLSEEMSKAGGVGLARLIVEQLTARRFDGRA